MPKSNGKVESNKRIDKRVAQYIAIRDEMKRLEEEHKLQLAPYQDAKDKLVGEMLEFLDSTGQEMARTAMGTVYSTVRHTAPLTDPDLFMDFVQKHGLYELLDRKANSTACREYAEEHGSLPPGVKINSTRTVGVRAS